MNCILAFCPADLNSFFYFCNLLLSGPSSDTDSPSYFPSLRIFMIIGKLLWTFLWWKCLSLRSCLPQENLHRPASFQQSDQTCPLSQAIWYSIRNCYAIGDIFSGKIITGVYFVGLRLFGGRAPFYLYFKAGACLCQYGTSDQFFCTLMEPTLNDPVPL